MRVFYSFFFHFLLDLEQLKQIHGPNDGLDSNQKQNRPSGTNFSIFLLSSSDQSVKQWNLLLHKYWLYPVYSKNWQLTKLELRKLVQLRVYHMYLEIEL